MRITALTERRGIISHTTTRAAVLTVGMKMDWRVSATIINIFVSLWHLWNGHDAILKERMFGLTGSEGNHAEDVKENYFYLDSTPTHSYMTMLYKYPQSAFPYGELVAENHRRGFHDFEYELMDTGAFSNNRYFDVFVKYAKADAEDMLIQIEVVNRNQSARRVYEDRAAARAFLRPLIQQMNEHTLGSISEIFDSDAPFTPRGCFAQAWSVAELLRVWMLTK